MSVGHWYSGLRMGDSLLVSPQLQNFVVPAFAIGICIVSARIGGYVGNASIVSLGRLHHLSAADRMLGIIGALLGLVFGVLVSYPLNFPSLAGNVFMLALLKFCIMLVCVTISVSMLRGMRNEMLRIFPAFVDAAGSTGSVCGPKFLDTNVIIDGRIADLCRTGFLEGQVFVPSFVLNELQYIADSSDSLRRARGRRGLESLNSMRALTHVVKAATTTTAAETIPAVQVLSEIPAEVARIDTVDAKLVALARELGGSIVTNDFNLNRVAELQGVKVLNINELTLALKPVVLPGEEMTLLIAREGKEPGQGVGYLDDGTMVVVSDGRNHINETCTVTISQVLQTVAGKMIFAELRGMKGAGDDLFKDNGSSGGRNNDDYSGRSGGGMRRKGRS